MRLKVIFLEFLVAFFCVSALEDPDTASWLVNEFQKKDLFLTSLSSDDGSEQENELAKFVWALVGVSAVLLVLLLAASFVYYVKFSQLVYLSSSFPFIHLSLTVPADSSFKTLTSSLEFRN